MLQRYFFILLSVACTSLYGCSESERSVALDTDKDTDSTTQTDTVKSEKVKTIVFFGNSLTAGYGLEPDQAFPALIQQRIDSLNLPYKVVNAGVSGETSAGGNSRINWLLKQPIDVFVLELGANDGLRGIRTDETYKNLQSIIRKVREKNPDAKIILAGMQMPPSMGQRYTKDFEKVYADLAKEENVALIPFLLDGVAGESKLNQADGIHPTEEGQKILANNVWAVLESILNEPSTN